MNFERLHYFAAVAEALNFTKAADTCHIAQTAMSRQIAAMEAELGVILFERNNRTVVLTPAGDAFYHDTLQLLDTYNAAMQRARNIAINENRTLKIGFGAYERRFVTNIVREFLQQMSDVVVSIEQYSYAELIKRIKSGALDIVFALPVSAEYVKDDNIEIVSIFNSETCIICCSGHPFANESVINAQHMRGGCCITISEDDGPASMDNFKERMLKQNMQLNKIIQANSLDAEFLMVAAGMGVSFVPRFLQPDLPENLVMKKQNLTPDGDFVALRLAENHNPIIDLFLTCVRNSDVLWNVLSRK